ncbi:MAG: site-2 protease family protein [Clostridia bacterium]|nr:site-2 protease family protein [Clostridia bacterium]
MKIPKKLPLNKFYKIKLTRHLFVNIWFFPIALCSFLGGYWQFFFTGFAVAFLHELAHILCAHFLKIPVSSITIFPFGINARLKTDYIKNSGKEFFIAFSGPFFNLILFWCSAILSKFVSHETLHFFADINLAICIINLFPALPLDGGRMLKSILTAKHGAIIAHNVLDKSSKICICLIGFFSIIILISGKLNLSLVLIFSFLLNNLSYEQSLISHIAFREIIESHRKLSDAENLPAKTFCANENALASDIIKRLSYDYFLIVHIHNSQSEIIKTLTETQILSALTKQGIRTRYKDI